MHTLIFRLVIYLVFSVSGAAALIYQVAWHRLLVVFAGGDVQAITWIVSAFMVGLGVGHWMGGSMADRSSKRKCLLLFALAELGIGLFGLASKFLYYDVLYHRFGPLAEARWIVACMLIAGLLIPTALMGVSLPFLARFMISEAPKAAGLTGLLYGMNTLGASLGALGTTWVLMPLLGIEGSLKVAAGINFICALLIFPLLIVSGRQRFSNSTTDEGHARLNDLEESPWTFRRCLVVFAISGFIALGLEMVWFRVLGVLLKSTTFTFGTLLFLYLAGIGLGAMVGTQLSRRVKRPGRLFLMLQVSIVTYACASLAAVLLAIHHVSALSFLRDYLDGYEPLDVNATLQNYLRTLPSMPPAEGAENSPRVFVWLHVLLPAILMGPPTFLMGLAFPLMQKTAHHDVAGVGRRVGWLQGANVFGSTIGTVAVGLCFLPQWGTLGTLRILAVLGGLLGWLWIGKNDSLRERALQIFLVIALSLALSILPNAKTLWALAHGTRPEQIEVAEDGAGVSVSKRTWITPTRQGPIVVYVNGIGQSWIPFGGVHSALGALPSLMHPNPKKIAVIGLGSGDTLYSSLSRTETESAVCIEIIGAELLTLKSLVRETPYAGLRRLLDDPRVDHIAGDGRRFLMMTDERFDIIEADALRPTSAYSGNLYSEEYFELAKSRLRPGGYAVTWAPTPRVAATFIKVFPYVIHFPHILVGSSTPIEFDLNKIRLRMSQPEIQTHFKTAGIDLYGLLDPFLSITTPIKKMDSSFDRSSLIDLNTDVHPKDEMALPALWSDS